tara:strand:- start:170 stop:433 length:264 start_codon:yes stop_codon:yes gene_type:complete
MTDQQDTTYNGWTNYETWQCALWIDNEPSLYFSALEVTSAGDLRTLVSEYLLEQCKDTRGSLLTDIIDGWECEVNFTEILETKLEDQ